LGAPADFVAISEGLIGDPLLIGLFLCGSSLAGGSQGGIQLLQQIKKPLSLVALRGVARDGSLPVGLLSHALGKDDDDAGNECDHAFSFPSGKKRVNDDGAHLTMWTSLSTD
jgi:hypothetical protein